jgi:hypothetical protein
MGNDLLEGPIDLTAKRAGLFRCFGDGLRAFFWTLAGRRDAWVVLLFIPRFMPSYG